MDIQKLSNEELNLLASIEGSDLVCGADDQTIVDKLMPACDLTTDLHHKCRGRKHKYVVVGPCQVICRSKSDISKNHYEHTNFIGMEELNFDRIIPTMKGDLICVFTYRDAPSMEYLIDWDSLESVFGKAGKLFAMWMNVGLDPILDVRKRAIEAAKRQKVAHSHIEDFGSW